METRQFQSEIQSNSGILGLLAVLNGLVLIAANLEAYKSRKVSTGYGESTYIGLIMGSMLQVVLVGAPLLIWVNDNPQPASL